MLSDFRLWPRLGLSRHHPKDADKGFTLIELLVTFLIGGVVVSGLLYLTNELLTSDQRESNRSETQRDLQGALDYISTELRQAVYVYENADCLTNNTGSSCDTFLSHENLEPIPDYQGTTSIPVLAFWKQTELSDGLIDACSIPGQSDPAGVTCLNGSGYSLVVYAYSANNNNDGPWEGEAGILRYEMKLTEESIAGSAPDDFGKYVSPLKAGVLNFRSWPDPDPGAAIQQAALAEPEVLIDFVDDLSTSSMNRTCPAANTTLGLPEYHASPALGNDSLTFPDELGGFYVCVNSSDALTGTRDLNANNSGATRALFGYGNQDVIIYMQGNAKGRSGLMTENSFTPTLESRVVTRGALNRSSL